jgi:hypothetical protein
MVFMQGSAANVESLRRADGGFAGTLFLKAKLWASSHSFGLPPAIQFAGISVEPRGASFKPRLQLQFEPVEGGHK